MQPSNQFQDQRKRRWLRDETEGMKLALNPTTHTTRLLQASETPKLLLGWYQKIGSGRYFGL